MAIELFATDNFQPSLRDIENAFVRAYAVLHARFGRPKSTYLAIAQGRARSGSGWFFRSNDLIVAGLNGGRPMVDAPFPRATLGHEMAHGWTTPTGPGTNFLLEGWATFAEALLLRDEFGPDVERTFWEAQRNRYERSGWEGTADILDDPFNSGIAYSKGSWIFRSLQQVLGDSVFDRGMADYLAIPIGRSAGVEELGTMLSRAAGWDVDAFLRPWLSESGTPDVEAEIEGGRVLLRQRGTSFSLPLTIEARGTEDTVRTEVWLTDVEAELEPPGDSALSSPSTSIPITIT